MAKVAEEEGGANQGRSEPSGRGGQRPELAPERRWSPAPPSPPLRLLGGSRSVFAALHPSPFGRAGENRRAQDSPETVVLVVVAFVFAFVVVVVAFAFVFAFVVVSRSTDDDGDDDDS